MLDNGKTNLYIGRIQGGVVMENILEKLSSNNGDTPFHKRYKPGGMNLLINLYDRYYA